MKQTVSSTCNIVLFLHVKPTLLHVGVNHMHFIWTYKLIFIEVTVRMWFCEIKTCKTDISLGYI